MVKVVILINKAKGYDILDSDNNEIHYCLDNKKRGKNIEQFKELGKCEIHLYHRNRPDCKGKYNKYEYTEYTGIWYIFDNRTYFVLYIPSLKNNKGPLIKKCSNNKTHPYVQGCLNNSGFYKIKTRQAPGIYFNTP